MPKLDSGPLNRFSPRRCSQNFFVSSDSSNQPTGVWSTSPALVWVTQPQPNGFIVTAHAFRPGRGSYSSQTGCPPASMHEGNACVLIYQTKREGVIWAELTSLWKRPTPMSDLNNGQNLLSGRENYRMVPRHVRDRDKSKRKSNTVNVLKTFRAGIFTQGKTD